MTYKHLEFKERCVIESMLKKWFLQKDIVIVLGVSKGTISREIKNNSILKNWTCIKQYLAKEA